MIMNCKIVFSLLVATLMSISAYAADLQIVIKNTDGKDATATLSKISNITIVGEDLSVNLNDGTKITAPIASIKKISVGDASGVEINPMKDGDEVAIACDGAWLSISGLEVPSTLSVVDINGKTLIRTTVSDGGNIDLSILSPGFYIATLGNKSLKFLRK